MPDRHDDVDAWLGERIEPLPPPPGTFELIKRKARRRKFRKLAITAGSAAVIVAAAVTVPQVVNLPVLNPNPTAAPVGAQSRSTVPSVSSSASGNGRQAASSAVSAGPVPVPGNFRPTSVTFVGPRTGWVIGQALTPGHCATQFCTSVARTDDAGKTWTGVPAPMAGPADGASGLTQIRFLGYEDSVRLVLSPKAPPAFTQVFSTINFDPPANTVPGNTSGAVRGAPGIARQTIHRRDHRMGPDEELKPSKRTILSSDPSCYSPTPTHHRLSTPEDGSHDRSRR
jgi:hypothetical protein